MKNKEIFNIIILGVGGQGQITLLQILANAALRENYDIKTSELHGLSQRGGSVEVHCRFGNKLHSPLIAQAGADLLVGLEMQETLRGLYYVNPKTKILLNRYISPIAQQKPLSEREILSQINKFTKNIEIVPATEICKRELENEIIAGIYLISFAAAKGFIPLKPDSIFEAIKTKIPKKHLELNRKAFELAQK